MTTGGWGSVLDPPPPLPQADKNKAEAAAGTTSTARPESDYEKLANAQADQYLAATKALDPLTSGANLPAINAKATQGAEQMLGTPSSSPVSQWLNAQTQNAAAQASGAGLTQANQAVSNAEQSAATLEAGGLRQMGQAETAMMQAAPYQQLLSSLAGEVPYHLAQGWNFPGLTGGNVPASIQAAEQAVGVSTQGQGTGAPGVPQLTPTSTPSNYSTVTAPPSSNPAPQG